MARFRVVYFLSFLFCLGLCQATAVDFLQRAQDLKAGLELLKEASAEYFKETATDLDTGSDPEYLVPRDPQFGPPGGIRPGGFGSPRPPWAGGPFFPPRPPNPNPAPTTPEDFARQVAELIDQLGNSLEALILFLRSNFPTLPPTTSTQSSSITSSSSSRPSTSYSTTTSVSSTLVTTTTTTSTVTSASTSGITESTIESSSATITSTSTSFGSTTSTSISTTSGSESTTSTNSLSSTSTTLDITSSTTVSDDTRSTTTIDPGTATTTDQTSSTSSDVTTTTSDDVTSTSDFMSTTSSTTSTTSGIDETTISTAISTTSEDDTTTTTTNSEATTTTTSVDETTSTSLDASSTTSFESTTTTSLDDMTTGTTTTSSSIDDETTSSTTITTPTTTSTETTTVSSTSFDESTTDPPITTFTTSTSATETSLSTTSSDDEGTTSSITAVSSTFFSTSDESIMTTFSDTTSTTSTSIFTDVTSTTTDGETTTSTTEPTTTATTTETTFVSTTESATTTFSDTTSTVTTTEEDTTTTTTSDTETTTTTTTSTTTSSTTSIPTFNPQARNLNAAYYGQTPLTQNVPLSQVCADTSVDIVILGFITTFYNGAYPTLNMGSHCWAATSAQLAANGPGLVDCVGDGFAAQVAQCQNQGKKVMLSMGGAAEYSDLAIPSPSAAVDLASTLWNLFLGGDDDTIAPLRPFGDVVFDGLDFDNEDPANSDNLASLATALRSLMDADPRPFYLSAAPQCPYPDLSVPVPQFISTIDFWFVQFYNNPSCQVDAGPGFLASLQLWSDTLGAGSGSPDKKARMKPRFVSGSGPGGHQLQHTHRRPSQHPRHRPATDVDATNPFDVPVLKSIDSRSVNNGVTSPLLFIGTAAFSWDTGGGSSNGYVTPSAYAAILQDVKNLNLPNLAGAAFWDGAYLVTGVEIVDGEPRTLADVVKDVLRPEALDDDDDDVDPPLDTRRKRSMSNESETGMKRSADVVDRKPKHKSRRKGRNNNNNFDQVDEAASMWRGRRSK
ncbi:hypothetical protein PV10_03384 [Exophiala mesophila]|uniref:chitinase n=1 Tax=Exophiala mesophila TaxID=212818 RepID=A0A0D1ZP59_EXOME|nr:uncharacterized protein PV10_03384 [Exophiala mesophila]KIV95769.1 hypothetical protein PV10_03384 [Exophiala mesophila]